MWKVGDHVENVGVYKGVVTEIGAGSYKGCYRVRSDNAGNPEYKGDFVCTLGQPGIPFLLDANGRRVRDVNAPGSAQADAKRPAEDVDVKAQRAADGRQNAPDDTQGGFKAGDRVEGQIGSKWKRCTVVEHRATGGYTLRCDDRPLEEIIFAASQVRAMQSPDADGGRQVAQDAKQTVDQAMAQCSGEPLLNLRTKGRAASDALFREVIRSMFDKEPRGEERIHKVVTKIVKFEVGKPYSWRPGTDNQRLGQAKMVYPVKTTRIGGRLLGGLELRIRDSGTAAAGAATVREGGGCLC